MNVHPLRTQILTLSPVFGLMQVPNYNPAGPWGSVFSLENSCPDAHTLLQSGISIAYPMFARSLFRCSRSQSAVFFSNRVSRNSTTFPTQKRSLVSAMAAFERLIRFQAEGGKTVYGNLEKETPTREIEGSSVEVLEGDVKSGFKKTGTKATVSKLLSPLPTTNIILCVGLNYRQHAEESNVRQRSSQIQLNKIEVIRTFISDFANVRSSKYLRIQQSS